MRKQSNPWAMAAMLTALALTQSCNGKGGSRDETFVCPAVSAVETPVPQVKRVFLVLLENEDADQASAQPFLADLGARGASLTDMHAIRHPSQPNYIALTAGDTLGVDSDDDRTLDTRHLGDLIEEKGKTWKVYAEGFPGNCWLGSSSGEYVRKHVPFLSYRNVQENPARCANIVPAAQLEQDVAAGRLPDFALYVPDNRNNGHDTSPTFADQWLRRTFEPLLANPAFIDGMLFIVSFDEAEDDSTNRIYAAMVGEAVRPGAIASSCYTHFNLLRTVEEALRLDTLGREDHRSPPIAGIWAH